MSRDAFLVIGQLARPHSIRGEIRVDYYADSLLFLEKKLWLRAGEVLRPVSLASWRICRGQPVIHLNGVEDRSGAELLRGQELVVEAAALPPADVPYIHDLIGLSVVLPEGNAVGHLENVFFLAGTSEAMQEVWCIRALAGHEILFPAVPAGPRL